MLFTGDVEEIAEQELIKLYKKENLDCDILKVAHHGSKSSSIEKFIEIVKPKIALIGVGEKNTFGHPSDEVVTLLEKNNAKIFRTDLNGEIEIHIDKNCKYKISTCIN